MQLFAARYRYVDLLRIGVVNVAVTARRVFVLSTFECVCGDCILRLRWSSEMSELKEFAICVIFFKP